jgi:hypothetical protein
MSFIELGRFSLLGFAIISIIVQLPHAFRVMDYQSTISGNAAYDFTIMKGKIKGNIGTIQNVFFCFIIANAILALVLLKMHVFAGIGAGIEIAINLYYVWTSYEQVYARVTASNSSKTKMMRLIGAYSVAVLLPCMIWVFSFLYAEFDYIIITYTNR